MEAVYVSMESLIIREELQLPEGELQTDNIEAFDTVNPDAKDRNLKKGFKQKVGTINRS